MLRCEPAVPIKTSRHGTGLVAASAGRRAVPQGQKQNATRASRYRLRLLTRREVARASSALPHRVGFRRKPRLSHPLRESPPRLSNAPIGEIRIRHEGHRFVLCNRRDGGAAPARYRARRLAVGRTIRLPFLTNLAIQGFPHALLAECSSPGEGAPASYSRLTLRTTWIGRG